MSSIAVGAIVVAVLVCVYIGAMLSRTDDPLARQQRAYLRWKVLIAERRRCAYVPTSNKK